MLYSSKNRNINATTAALALAVSLSVSAPVMAQVTNAAAEDDGGIVVTAQRREERATDVPITLTALSEEALGQGDVQQLGDIAKLTPALRFDYQGGFAQPTIRGVGTAVSASGAGSNVAIYVDGFYAPNPLSADFQLLNVSGIAVLKGPQGTLFGRNSTGGAILVTTSDPSSETRGQAEVSFGRFNAQKYQAYVTSGTESVAFDVGALYRRGNGFVRNIVTGSKHDGEYDAWSVRLGVKFTLSETASIKVRYAHADTADDTTLATNSYVLPNGRVQSIGAIIPGVVTAFRSNEVSNTSRTDFDNKTDTFQLTGEFDLGFADLSSYTQYRKEGSNSFLDLDGSSAPVFDVDFYITDKIFTQEFVLASKGDGALRWTAGLFYFSDQNRFRHVDGYVGGGPATNISKSQTDTKTVAGFLDLTYAFSDQLFVTAGARVSRDTTTNASFTLGPLAGNSGLIPVPSIKDTRVTPRFVIRYKPSDHSSVFASFSRGYKAGILNVSGFEVAPKLPETISAYEVGYKYGARGLTFDVSAYYYDYTNLQNASYNGTQSIITNAASARIKGIESQITYEPTDALRLNAGVALMDGNYRRFPGAPIFNQCLVPACGAGFGLFPSATIDASGFRMARAPKFTGNIGARYQFDVGGGKLALSGNLSYSSKFYFDVVQQFFQKGYELASVRAEWTDAQDRFTLAVYGDNITNSRYLNQVLPGQFAIQTVWGYPVTWGVSARVKF